MNKKILIIEDEEDYRSILVDLFTIANISVLVAKDGQEGLTLALKEHPGLILLDVLLPKMDGVSLLSNLRQDEWGRNVPVMLLTNLSAGDASISNIKEDNLTKIIYKSNVNLDELEKKVKAILEKSSISS